MAVHNVTVFFNVLCMEYLTLIRPSNQWQTGFKLGTKHFIYQTLSNFIVEKGNLY